MNKKVFSTQQLVVLALLCAIVLIMSSTPLGTLPLGPLSITLNMIPIAIAAIVVGPFGGLVTGTVFGMFSFLQAMGLFVPSAMGMLTFSINPGLTFIQRVLSRALVGLLAGYGYLILRKIMGNTAAFFGTGLLAAFLNFVFFMGMLILFFGGSDSIAAYWAGKTVLAYLIATFLSNTIFEIIATTILTGVVATALYKAKGFVVKPVNV